MSPLARAACFAIFAWSALVGCNSGDQGPPPVSDAGPPDLQVSGAIVDFGPVDCGGAAPQDKVITLTNDGGGSVSWTAQLQSQTFSITGATSGAFNAGDTATITVHTAGVPAQANAGDTYTATLIVTGAGRAYQIPVTMTAQGATLTLMPSTADFGEIPIGTQAPDIALTVKNVGNKDATVGFGTPSATDFAIAWTGSPVGVDVKPGATVAGAVARFKPSSLMPQNTTSPITVNGAVCGQSVAGVPMKGTGTGGVVAVSPGTLDFGLVDCGGRADFQFVGITNTGNAPFTWMASLGNMANPAYDFQPKSGMTLPGSTSLVFVVPRSIPKTSLVTANLYGDTLTITTNAPNDTPHSVKLLETAQGAILAFTSSQAAFGTQNLFVSYPAQQVSLVNSGNSAATVTLTTTQSAYQVTPSTPTPVMGGSTIPVGVAFDPTTFGPQPDTVSISTNDVLCAPLPTVALTGTGKLVATQVVMGGGRGDASACALLPAGHVACWGHNQYGELGQGYSSGITQQTPIVVPGFSGATALAGDGDYNCAIASGGSLWCWGRNDKGQLGLGSTAQALSPTQVPSLSNVTAVAANHRQTCAIMGSNVYCWGTGHRGQLGDGNPYDRTTRSTVPVKVAVVTGATSIAVGGSGACALAPAGTYCWGDNGKGQLGNGTTGGGTSTPALVASLSTNVAWLTAGGNGGRSSINCAALNGHTVDCWGDGSHGKIGNGTAVTTRYGEPTPTAVSNITTAVAVAAGRSHVCALTQAGTVTCWGQGNNGQLGDGLGKDSAVPVIAQGVSTATQIAAGGLDTCALLSSGAVQCWGDGSQGQLGNPQATGTTPTTVSGF